MLLQENTHAIRSVFYVFPSKSIGFSIAANRHKSVVMLRLRKPDAALLLCILSSFEPIGRICAYMYVWIYIYARRPQCYVVYKTMRLKTAMCLL